MPIKPLVKHIILYSLVHMGLLLSTGIFWDDWSIINVSEETLKDQFINNGVLLGYYFHYPFWLLKSPWLYHAMTFIMYGVAYVFIGKILQSNIFNWKPSNAWAMVYLLDVLPFNESKITAICSFYTVCFFLFILGFYLFHCRQEIRFKITGIILLLGGFLTPSIPFYYITVLMAMTIINGYDKDFLTWLKNAFSLGVKKYGIPIFLAGIYFIVYRANTQPNQVSQAGYNEISHDHIGEIPMNMVKTTYINAIEFYQQVPKVLTNKLGIFVFLLCTIGLLVFKNSINMTKKQTTVVMATGLFLWLTAMIPYLAIGKLPTFYEHLCRHHLLTPIGFSLVIIGALSLFGPKIQSMVYIVVMAFFGTITFGQYLSYQAEQIKMTWLQTELATMKAIDTSYTMIIKDNANSFKSNENPNRYYSWAGLLHSISGKQNKFMGNKEELEYVNSYPEKYCLSEFNMKDYKPKISPDLELTIEEVPITQFVVLKSWIYFGNNAELSKIGNEYLNINYD